MEGCPSVPPPAVARRVHPLLWGIAAAIVLAAGWLPNHAEGYRFLIFGPHYTVITSSSWPPFATWDTNFWPPGEAVEIGIVEDPARSRGVYERVKRLTEDSLRYWSEVGTADLKFDVRIISPEAHEQAENGLFVVVTDDEPPRRAGGSVQIRQPVGEALAFAGCRVRMPNYYLNSFGTPYVIFVLVHEFGHCLGLHHPPAYPDVAFRDQLVADAQPGQDPVMSYGWNPTRRFETTFGAGRLTLVTLDDAVGISLLRPAPGWLETTGGISGRVLQDDGTAVRFAPLLATRLEDGEPVRFGVNTMTDSFGSFSIDGLDPGSYLVKLHPILFPEAHRSLLREATLEFPETTVLGAVEVRAGTRTEPLTIYLRPEEN